MIFLTFLFISFSIYYPLANYDLMPDRIPTHFDKMGRPDAWSDKSIGTLLLAPLITIPTLLIMLPIAWWIAIVEDPRKIINASKKRIEKIGLEKAEEIRKMSISHILFIMMLVSLLILLVSVNQVQVAIEGEAMLGLSVNFIVAVLILDSIYITWKSIKMVYF